MNIFRRIDHYLLINYPLIWLSKIVYILPVCLFFLLCIAVWGYQWSIMMKGNLFACIGLMLLLLIFVNLMYLSYHFHAIKNKFNLFLINFIIFLAYALLFVSVPFVSIQKLQQKTKNLITISPNDTIPIESKILDLLQKQADTLTVALFDTTISKNIKEDQRNLYAISNTDYNDLLIKQIIGTDKSIYRQQPLIQQVKQVNFDSIRQAYQIPAKRICKNYEIPYKQESIDDNIHFFMKLCNGYSNYVTLEPLMLTMTFILMPWLMGLALRKELNR